MEDTCVIRQHQHLHPLKTYMINSFMTLSAIILVTGVNWTKYMTCSKIRRRCDWACATCNAFTGSKWTRLGGLNPSRGSKSSGGGCRATKMRRGRSGIPWKPAPRWVGGLSLRAPIHCKTPWPMIKVHVTNRSLLRVACSHRPQQY